MRAAAANSVVTDRHMSCPLGARWLSVVSMAVATTSAPVAAQELGTRIDRFKPAEINNVARLSERDQAQATMDEFATCMVDFGRQRATDFLALPPGDEAKNAGQKLVSSECLRFGSMSFPVEILRGGLFRALYRKDFRISAPALSEKPIDYIADVGGKADGPIAVQYIALRQFGECVVRADVANSRELTLAPIGSTREKAAFKALNPHFGPCLQQGINASFSKQMLSGLIAESLYRLSTTPASSAGSH